MRNLARLAIVVAAILNTSVVQAQPSPEFEVASVRLSSPEGNPEAGFINASTPSLNVDGDRSLVFVQITLRDLIMLAYGVGARQIQGPTFLNGTPASPADRFNVNAKVPAGAKREQVPLMLQALLAERFHLALHRDNKPMQVFALEVAKGGIKIKETKESTEGTTTEARCTRSFAEREGATLAAVCTGLTSADIAQQVQTLAPGYFRDGPVVDSSGLKGVYDFKLEWITNGEAQAGSSGPTMFEAVQSQLGLKLEKRQQAVEMLIVDKLDRTPTEN